MKRIEKLYDGNCYYKKGTHKAFISGYTLELPNKQFIKILVGYRGINIPVTVEVTNDGIYLLKEEIKDGSENYSNRREYKIKI